MRHCYFQHLLVLTVLISAGCSGKTEPGKDGVSSDMGWKIGAEDTQPVPARSKGYGQIHASKGDEVRATIKSTNRPIDVRLYVDYSGKPTNLGKKEQVMEATLAATVPYEGEILLQMIGGKDGDTDVRYKLESRPGQP